MDVDNAYGTKNPRTHQENAGLMDLLVLLYIAIGAIESCLGSHAVTYFKFFIFQIYRQIYCQLLATPSTVLEWLRTGVALAHMHTLRG